MTHEVVIFNREVRGEGRNGLYRQSGLSLTPYGDGLGGNVVVDIHGITSRQTEARGKIAIPAEDLHIVISALQDIQEELKGISAI